MADIVERLRAITGQAGDYGDVQLCDAAADAIESLRREVLEQRREIAGLREERRAVLQADRPQMDELA